MTLEYQVSDGEMAEMPLLPQSAIDQAEELHEGKLWAWTPIVIGQGHHLAVALANMPGMRPVTAIPFPSYQDAEFASKVHNHERGISEEESAKIVASSAIAEHVLENMVRDAKRENH